MSSIVQIVLEALSRRDFLRNIGRGAAAAIAMPWTNLLSAPELAAKVAAPFKIGAGSMLNPHMLYKFYLEDFEQKAIDSGISPVGKMMAGGGEDEIPEGAFHWVAKNFVDNYVDDQDHVREMEDITVAPSVAGSVNSVGVEDFLEWDSVDRNFPDWAKDLLRKGQEYQEAEDEQEGSGKMSAEDHERYSELMRAKWFDPEDADNWDYQEEEVDGLLSKWMGLTGRSDSDATDDPVLDQVFDHISNLIHHEGYAIDQVYKMDFRKQFLPGVADMIKSNAADVAADRAKRADAEVRKDDDARGEVPSRHPYGVGSPQSGLQTASTKPTFKEFFNGRYRDAQD